MTTQQILDIISDKIDEYSRVMNNTYERTIEEHSKRKDADNSKIDKLFHKYNELLSARDALMGLYLEIIRTQIEERK